MAVLQQRSTAALRLTPHTRRARPQTFRFESHLRRGLLQDVNWADHRGMSAYLYACQHGHRDVVELLCDATCERAQTNREGFTGRDMAKKWFRTDVCAYLDTISGGETPRAKGPARMGKARGKDRVEREAKMNLRGMSVLEDRARAEAEAAMAALSTEGTDRMATFGEEGEEEEDEEETEQGETVTVTFTQPGSLGLKFTPNKATGAVEVMGINPGTQATTHPQLQPGLTLLAVGATSVVGMPYPQVIETIKAQGRPVTCQFSSAAASPAQSPQAAAPARAAPAAVSALVAAPTLSPVVAVAPAPVPTPSPPPVLPPVSAEIAARKPAVLDLNGRYTCVQRSMIRSGYSMESDKVGILEIGDIVLVKETRVNEANTTRVSFERGWTNATMTDGRPVLAPLSRKAARPRPSICLCLNGLWTGGATPQVQSHSTIPADRQYLPVCTAYTCLKRCMMREGFEMDSPKVGVLEVGETVMVAERTENEASIFRCKFIAPNGAICWCVQCLPRLGIGSVPHFLAAPTPAPCLRVSTSCC